MVAACVAVSSVCAAVLGERASAAEQPRGILVQGDSLAVGMKPSLEGFVRVSDYDAEDGRSTETGLERLLVREVRGRVILLSLGTNDLYRSTRWFRARVRRVRRAVGPRGCVVWGLIRAPAFAQDARRLNEVLRANRGPRFRLVRPNGPYVDGVHLTAAGYRLKAQRFAAAARGC